MDSSEWNPADSVSRGEQLHRTHSAVLMIHRQLGVEVSWCSSLRRRGGGETISAEPTEVFSDTTGSGGAPQGNSSHLAG